MSLEIHPTTNLMNVTYTDPYSAGKKSMRDLQISFNQRIFAAGSKRLATFKRGDYVIICATEGSIRKCFVAQIVEKMEEAFTNWHEEGGRVWDYNFTIVPLTGITDITPRSDIRNHMEYLLEDTGLKKTTLFNSRFCSKKLLSGLCRLMDEGMFNPL